VALAAGTGKQKGVTHPTVGRDILQEKTIIQVIMIVSMKMTFGVHAEVAAREVQAEANVRAHVTLQEEVQEEAHVNMGDVTIALHQMER
jgi:hypothetical protein